MKLLKRIFHFLGGIYFAIFLIAATALFVIIGTFLEASYDSHLYAAQWTYQSDLFALLLALFFINILFSSLRRWPFKVHHIPFLVTHVGLLMVISGCLIKQRYGLQGNMFIMEGGNSHDIILPHTHALHVERKDPFNPKKNLVANMPLSVQHRRTYTHKLFPEIALKIQNFSPHVHEKFQAWIKGEQAYFYGISPIKVQNWITSHPIQSIAMQFPFDPYNTWNVSILRTDDIQEAIKEVYTRAINVKITSKNGSNTEIIPISLSHMLNESTPLLDGHLHAELDLSFSIPNGFIEPVLKINYQRKGMEKPEKSRLLLQGSEALRHMSTSENLIGFPSFEIDLERSQPHLVLIEDSQGDCHLFAFDRHGRVQAETICSSAPRSLIMYDQGFGGYAIQSSIPFFNLPAGRREKQLADQYILVKNIRQTLTTHPTLSPPLKVFKAACDRLQIDFPSTLIDFLSIWHDNYSLLLPEHVPLYPDLIKIAQHIDWTLLSKHDLQACQWISFLCHRFEQHLGNGENIFEFLKKNRWPFMNELEGFSTSSQSEIIRRLSTKMFDLAPNLPSLPISDTLKPGEQAHLLSAYFKAFGIEYHLLMNAPEGEKEDFSHLEVYYQDQSLLQPEPFLVEGPLTVTHIPEKPLYKLEDNCPGIVVQMKHGTDKQMISLSYDPMGEALKWPIFNGKYLLRYQAQCLAIPYTVRLRQARQINYMDSNQPYSYESDIVISEKDKIPVFKTLSMNRVHETWDGYRFYLSGITTLSSGLKRIQVVVNYDPVKYYLTYPGGVIISGGIILLFWIRPYTKRKK